MACTTDEQKNTFEVMLKDKFDLDILDEIIDWIIDNMSMDEVYTETQVKDHVQLSFSPSAIFDESELGEWARDNGYILTD